MTNFIVGMVIGIAIGVVAVTWFAARGKKALIDQIATLNNRLKSNE